MKPVCLVLGAGAGIGGTVAKNLLWRAIIPVYADDQIKGLG